MLGEAQTTPEAKQAQAPARRRARYPQGHEKAGQFVPDDPGTPDDEAFEE